MTKRPAGKQERLPRRAGQPVSSSSPLGLLALYLLDVWRRPKSKGLIFVSEDERRAEQVGAILHAFEPQSGVMVLPRLDAFPFDGLQPSRELTGRRASVLRRMAEAPEQTLLIATAEACLVRVPDASIALETAMRLRLGDPFDEPAVREFLSRGGYSLDEPVEMAGSALFLGHILEVFPAGALGPVRLDYRDGQVRKIVAYDMESQARLGDLCELMLDSVPEWRQVGTTGNVDSSAEPAGPGATVFDYVSSAMVIVDFAVESHLGRWMQQLEEVARDGHEDAVKKGFLTKAEWEDRLRASGAEVLPRSISKEESVPSFAVSPSPIKAFRGFLEEQRAAGHRIVFAGASRKDLRTMDRRAGGTSKGCTSWREIVKAKRAQRLSLEADLDRGFFHARSNAIVIAAADLLGSRASHSDPIGNAAATKLEGNADLAPGDVVIHIGRGLAILHGLETVAAPGIEECEMLRLEFAAGDSVLVPVSELGSIWRYSSDPTAVSLDKADGSSWEKRRTQVELEISAAVAHVRKLKARRRALEAPKLVPPAAEYERFAARFRYLPTTDQATAVEEVLRDLASGHPMDRLICGDVGYGKTEVALRAAAATVFSGKQVAVAVPTTVLARQHVETFRRRFAPFGVEIGHISRFVVAAEAKLARERLSNGELRLVIGTHALASKNVHFSDLGLLVIDEEQRFGQADKAKLAGLAEGLHLLTMTATPLPRTLAEAQAGFREVSVIATPPVRRAPVKTTVEPFEESRVADALRREHRRGGQSFVVCPRIEDIAPMQKRLEAVVSELTMLTVHGRMAAQDIDEAMMSFAGGRADVLLTTNIIENGLDLPRANTILVWRPDRFGIAQLHQLRGRVGRGSTRGVALLLMDPDAKPSRTATSRLAALTKAVGAGAGFVLSVEDMELRGRGDLFSEQQSGHVKILGPALYKHMVDLAWRSQGSPGRTISAPPSLNLGRLGSLPKTFIKDDPTRLGIYARISKCNTERELDDLRDEIEERFGELPDQVDDLFETTGTALECRRLGVLTIDAGPESIAATLPIGLLRKGSKLAELTKSANCGTERVLFKRASNEADRLAAVHEVLDLLRRSLDQH